MFGFHKPKMHQSILGCCICRVKSSSSWFMDSKCYVKDFQSHFGLHETCSGDICYVCVLLVKRWKKLPDQNKQTNKQTNKQKPKLESCGRCKSRPQSKDNIETKESENSICCSRKNAAAEKPKKQKPAPLSISTQEW